ncbi:MAG: WXG-repeat protein [Acidobacteria bacterium]|nr:WXG-repeat protein [Acidobacteriota bacterium]
MSQVHNDSEKLRGFASQLDSFAGVVDDHITRIRAAMSRLGNSWRDQEFEEFAGEFLVTQERIKRFVEETKRTTPLLKRDADALDEYFAVRAPR